jgi:hypothetical protein
MSLTKAELITLSMEHLRACHFKESEVAKALSRVYDHGVMAGKSSAKKDKGYEKGYARGLADGRTEHFHKKKKHP